MAGFWPCCCGGCDPADLYLAFNGQEAGGRSTNTESYDAGGDAWVAESTILSARYMMAYSNDDTYVYTINGNTATDAYINDTWKFCKADGTWSVGSVTPDTMTHQYGNSAGNAGDRIDLFGGMLATTAVTNAHLSFESAWSTRANLPSQNTGACVNTTDGTYDYMMCGRNSTLGIVANVRQYNPAGDSFASKANATSAVQGAATISDKSNQITVTGGTAAFGSPGKKNYVYSESGNSWSTKTDMTTNRFATSGMSRDGTYGYVGGGVSSVTPSAVYESSFERYDFGGDTWSTKAALAVAIRDLGMGS